MAQSAAHIPSDDQFDDEIPADMDPSLGDIDESIPTGFQAKGGDLVGYWEPSSQQTNRRDARPGSPAVLFTPLFVTLSDSKMKVRPDEPTKSATLLHARLDRPCVLRSAKKEEGYKIFPKGSLFGIWTKPGMKALQNLGNTTVWMKNAGFKDVGQMSDMVVFDIRWEKDGERLKVQDDRRDKSLPANLRAARAQVTDRMDDIPF